MEHFQLEALKQDTTPNIMPYTCIRLFLLVVVIGADSRVEVTLEDTSLQIDRSPASTSRILLLEVPALGKLPCLDTKEEEESSNKDYTPLPADARVPEHNSIDNGDVKDREDGDETAHYGEEQELVPPHIMEPLGEVLLRARLHHEERTAHINHLPGEEQREPRKAGKSSSTSTEDGSAAVVKSLVTTGTQVAVAESEHDYREGCETEGGDPKTVDKHVNKDFDSENTTLELKVY